MPFVNVVNKLNPDHSRHGWQMRISIDPRAVDKNSPFNRIDVIKAILKDKLQNFPADAKLFEIDNYEELIEQYDGTTSTTGLDRDQRGKEICIHFNDSNQNQPTLEEYKKLILSLWHAFQGASVPLIYMENPGDRKILGPLGLYTPFSFTSEEARSEWNDKHGLVFKQFVGYDSRHPLLQVEFTEQDLRDGDISFNSEEIIHNTRTYISTHQQDANRMLQVDFQKLNNTRTYHEDLFDDAFIKIIKDKLEEYDRTFQTLPVTQKGNYQARFGEELKKFPAYKRLVEDYPHEPTSRFPALGCISAGLGRWQNLSLPQFDQIIDQLRNEYDNRINDIKNDFAIHTNLKGNVRQIGNLQLPPTPQLQNNITIDWEKYFPGQDVERLIELNPKGMQVMYRRIVFLEREKQAYQAYQERVAAIPVINITPNVNVVELKKGFAKALAGIQTYIARPRDRFSFQTHLGFFARMFQNDRGLKRAQVYQDILRNDNYTVKQKALALYALLATTNGTQLKEDVAEAILGPGNRNVIDARNQVAQLVRIVCQTEQNGQRHEEIVRDIVRCTNAARLGNATDIPPATWNGINDVAPNPVARPGV